MIEAGEAEFHDQPAAGPQHARGIGHDAVVEFEAGAAGEQGDVRLEIADFALQPFAVGERNVGRVGDDQVHRAGGDGVHQVAGHEADIRAQACGVARGHAQGGGRDVRGPGLRAPVPGAG